MCYGFTRHLLWSFHMQQNKFNCLGKINQREKCSNSVPENLHKYITYFIYLFTKLTSCSTVSCRITMLYSMTEKLKISNHTLETVRVRGKGILCVIRCPHKHRSISVYFVVKYFSHFALCFLDQCFLLNNYI